MQKTYLVFGAAGSIGSRIVNELVSSGHRVIASVRSKHESTALNLLSDRVWIQYDDDVADREKLDRYTLFKKLFDHIDGVIYAIGHCPPGGFPDAIKYPLSQLPLSEYRREIDMHQVGVLNVFQRCAPKIEIGGCFVFISSAITRLRGNFPPFLQAYHHASVIDAEDWLIDGMRHDPLVVERKIKIHRLAPAAVDTPFHQAGPRPPKLISIDTVVAEVVSAIESNEYIDKQIL